MSQQQKKMSVYMTCKIFLKETTPYITLKYALKKAAPKTKEETSSVGVRANRLTYKPHTMFIS